MGCGSTKDKDVGALHATVPAPIERELKCSIAEEYAECAVCFEPLCEAPCGVLQRNGRRVCRHLIHQHCAEAMQCAGRFQCPECRAPFEAVSPLPKLGTDNIQAWFRYVDVDGDGRLSKMEVLQVLKAQYRLDWRSLDQHIDRLWATWDQDGSGNLAFDELTAPNGLVHYVTGSQVACAFAPMETSTQQVPPLCNSAAWFKFWDDDNNGSLDIQEVQRALLKTFQLGKNVQSVAVMQETLEVVWPIFDPDGSGSIDFEEYTMPGGLGEALILAVESMKNNDGHRMMRVPSQTRLGG